MTTKRTIELGQVFTPTQLHRANRLYATDRDHFHARALKEIVEPAMEHINKVTGQENDAGYWTYALEYALSQTEGGNR